VRNFCTGKGEVGKGLTERGQEEMKYTSLSGTPVKRLFHNHPRGEGSKLSDHSKKPDLGRTPLLLGGEKSHNSKRVKETLSSH